jgi:hypothetical protein
VAKIEALFEVQLLFREFVIKEAPCIVVAPPVGIEALPN